MILLLLLIVMMKVRRALALRDANEHRRRGDLDFDGDAVGGQLED